MLYETPGGGLLKELIGAFFLFGKVVSIVAVFEE
jgi:hypothetical protein